MKVEFLLRNQAALCSLPGESIAWLSIFFPTLTLIKRSISSDQNLLSFLNHLCRLGLII